MIILASLVAVMFLALLVELFLLQDRHAKAEAAWINERRELLNRIQRPEHIPVAPMPDFVQPEREPDGWAQVGQITISDKYGLDD